MRSSFLDYAMSVIVSRALPDVRDGLKPVHRRVLYAMHEAGLQPNRPRLKCARVVGDVMGSYHPHGDVAIYDTLVRLAQPFSMRYPLVDGQGNFGNIDDYPAAAMRYTECRLTRLATELLRDIDADTVDFVPNYDESRRQPSVLPARYPNLLVIGSSGIAVGMATNIPAHNLGEVTDALVAMIDDPMIDVERLTKHIKGPDFPTGGIIVGREGIREAYRSGRGRIVMRGRAHIEELRGGKTAIIVNELPFGVKKGGDSGVILKIADLVNDKVLTEISDVKDLSDKTGMRIQIDLKREAIPQVVLNKLYKHTPLQTTFGYNAVALVDGVPKTLALRDLLSHYLEFQREVVTRARQPRRGDRADPCGRRHRCRSRRADARVRTFRDPGPGDPRPPPARAHRARTQARRGRACRLAGADHRAARDPRRRVPSRRLDPRGAARDQGDLREE
jgi:DNA gyrase subunit A